MGLVETANGLAENVWLRLISRLAMVVGSMIILPLGTWMLSSTYARIDKQQESIIVLQTKVDLLTQTVDYNAKQAIQAAQAAQNNIDGLKVLITEVSTVSYRGKDADRDQRLLEERFRRIEERLNTLDASRVRR